MDEHNFLNLFEKSPILFFEWKNETGWPIVSASGNFTTITGYDKEIFLSQEKLYSDIIHPDDIETLQSEADHQVENNLQQHQYIPYRLIKKNGEIMWVREISSPKYDEQGNFTHFIGFVIDITTEKEREYETHAILDSEPGFVIVTETGKYMTQYNQKFLNFLGFHTIEDFREKHQCACEFFINAPGFIPGDLEGRWIQEILRNKQLGIPSKVMLFDKTNNMNRIYSIDAEPCGPKGKKFIVVLSDITEFEKAQQEIENSRNRFRAMFENHSAVMLLIAPEEDGKIIDANQAALTYYGYTKEEILETSIKEINQLPPEDAQKEMEKAGKEKRNYFIFKHRLKNGIIRDVEVHSSPFESEERHFLFSVIHDVTEREAYKREMKESQRRFKMLSDTSSEAHYLIEEGKIFDVNSTITSMLGYAPEELIGHSPALFVDAKFHDVVTQHVQENDASNYEVICVRKDGSKFHAEMRPRMVPYHGRLIRATTLIDQSERARMENELKTLNATLRQQVELEVNARYHSEKLFREITNSSFDGMLTIDENGKIILWNPACERIFGYKRKEAINRDMHMLIVDPQLYPLFRKGFGDFVKTGKGPVVGNSTELEGVHKDGHHIPIEVSVFATKFDDRWYASGIVRDLTEKRMQDKDKEARDNLLRQQSKMAEMGNMIGAIVHQWKQPITGIHMLAQTLEEEAENDTLENSTVLKTSQHILEQINFMTKTMNDFRDYFKPSKHRRPFSPKKSALNMYAMLRKHYIHSNVQVNIEGDDSINAFGYDNEFKQVLLNILNNARDLFVEQKRKDGQVNVHITSSDNKAIISIHDNGGGIPEELLPEKIFEPYISTKGDAGTGIGLSMSKTLIEDSMQGELLARNIGEGAEFIIELPMHEPSNTIDFDFGVIYAEDEEIARKTMFSFLEHHFQHAFVAANGYEALDKYKAHTDTVRLLITDYNMPNMNGLELVQAIQKINPDVEIIMMTAFVEDIKDKIPSNIKLIEKPIRKKILMEEIKTLFGE